TPAPQPEPPVASTAQPGEPAQPADRPPPADEPAPATAPTATHPGPPVDPGMASGSGVVRNSKGEVIASVGGDGSTSTSEPRTPAVSGKVVASGPGYTVSVAQNTGDRPLRLASATSTPAVNNAPVERR